MVDKGFGLVAYQEDCPASGHEAKDSSKEI